MFSKNEFQLKKKCKVTLLNIIYVCYLKLIGAIALRFYSYTLTIFLNRSFKLQSS